MPFIINKYTNCYFSIIATAKSRILSSMVYTEKHHIIPKSLGGSNLSDNLVRLTAREHFICHLLLPKMTSGLAKRGMAYASWQMTFANNRDRYKPTARIYELIKTQLSVAYTGIPKTSLHWLGKTHSVETKLKQSKIKQGKNNPMYGRKQSADAMLSSSLKQLGIPKPKFICEHCNKIIGGKSNYLRYHGAQCKLNTTL